MLSQSPDSEQPVGFVSFSQDLVQNDLQKRDEHFDSMEMSFAETKKDNNEAFMFN
jgi:predicted nuclease of restriction endonuclease-like RecB superfamily